MMSDLRACLADALREHEPFRINVDGGWIGCSCDGGFSRFSAASHRSHLADVLLSLPSIEITEWRDIPGFPGYRVSDFGVVQSFKFTTPRYLNHTLALGYPTVSMTAEDGSHHHVRVHVAIMRSFVGPPPEGMEVRHLDGNPLNCRLDNLAYGTSSENGYDTVRHGKNHNVLKTTCPKGHPYLGANLIIKRKPSGSTYRICRECKNQREQRRYRRKVDVAARAADQADTDA